MSGTLREGELTVSLPASAKGRKFDDETHQLSHCMKAVDWIIDLPGRTYFVELKDLDAGGAAGHGNRRQYVEDLKAEKRDMDLVTKFRDSFIYCWACEQMRGPTFYLVLIACKALHRAMLLHRTDALRRKLPSGRPAGWTRAMAEDVSVFNEETWNERLAEFPMVRTS